MLSGWERPSILKPQYTKPMNRLTMRVCFAFVAILLSLIFSGCRREGQSYTITGRILQDCSGQPFANKPLSFHQKRSGGFFSAPEGVEIGTTTTDSAGNFSAVCGPASGEGIEIRTGPSPNNRTIMLGVPARVNVKDLLIYIEPSTVIQVKLNVVKQYTANDTLYITDFANPLQNRKLVGPFVDGTVITTPGFKVFQNYYNLEGNRRGLGYKLNSQNWSIKDFYLVPCDTSRVVATIN